MRGSGQRRCAGSWPMPLPRLTSPKQVSAQRLEATFLSYQKVYVFCLLFLIFAEAVAVAAVFKSAGHCAASAGTSCGRYLSFQGDRQELSAEALALFAVERLLPPVLRAAGKSRALTENRSHRLLAALPPTLAVVVEEGNADEAALGPHADDPHEPLWIHLNRASTHQREGMTVLQTWMSTHPAGSSAAAPIDGEKQSSPLSLVGALQAPKKRRDAGKSDVSLDPTFLSASGDELDAAAPAGWKEEDKMSELLGALKALSRFGSEYGLFPAPSRKKADTGNQNHSHGEAETCTVSPVLSAIRALPRAEPVKSFVMAFKRYKPACWGIAYPVSELCYPYRMCYHLLTVLRIAAPSSVLFKPCAYCMYANFRLLILLANWFANGMQTPASPCSAHPSGSRRSPECCLWCFFLGNRCIKVTRLLEAKGGRRNGNCAVWAAASACFSSGSVCTRVC